ncbi:MAG TPA: 50S ribosomal protein L22 [Spirochaetota bacterium]|jgi:large subunit ribosomal protein L22|nr:50S ribosomal protein L22 [Spirochaetota bacterium]OQB00369.1 MAG: 50S ribosomal protein L22 [Spirochaetes bacterium ADurb.Bin218]HON16711.1 50S ribosomal protein L22 [Spirochaetota bacterium]HOQ10739.1 50S ribosomal protein L22 [Spirochaetota bacterium]HOV08272.1 50S ribosomal protein L22 [Spirochaetota bacterium]
MESSAKSKLNRISASKMRLVANEVKGFSLPEAVDILKNMPQKGAKIVLKTLYSAGANAKYKNPDIIEDALYIKKIAVDEGPTMKRFQARARGRAGRIRKRTSHLTIILSDEN